MKLYLSTFILALIATGLFAQNDMMHVPNGTSGISGTVTPRGVAIGPGFDKPLARLHLKDDLVDGTSVFIDIESTQQFVTGGSFWDSPDYFIEARFKDASIGNPTYQNQIQR